MDLLTKLSEKTQYTDSQLQLIVGAWVMSGYFEGRPGHKAKISSKDGDVSEADYNKQSIYSLLYALYRSVGEVRMPDGTPWQLTFNTWGYAWPSAYDKPEPNPADPQRFGRNAYTGLMMAPEIQKYVGERDGRVHVIEMGCGTGAGAHHICKSVLPKATYRAVDMQASAVETCRRLFVPGLDGRLVATHCDATRLDVEDGAADIVVVCETHVTEREGVVTPEDERFFKQVARLLKKDGFFTWGNAIPDRTWKPCFDYLESIGLEKVRELDVTEEAVRARDLDQVRVDAWCEQTLARFPVFKLPGVGAKRRRQADVALKNFFRNPGTKLYENMTNGQDSYRVVQFCKRG